MAAVVLVEPENPRNTGFIARLADNFNFDLRLVNPDFNLSEARKTANNAQDKLRNARIYSSVEEAVAGLDYLLGSKPGGEKLSGMELPDNCSLMVGPESSGLENRHLELCDAVAEIETTGYSSLSQSHAAAVLMYEASVSDAEIASQESVEALEEIAPERTFRKVMESSPSEEDVQRIIAELRRN